MGDTCIELKSDKTALSLYNDLLVRSGNNEGKLDRGYWESDYTSSSTPSRILKSLQDGKVCAQEVYDEAIETAEIEIPWTLQDKDVLKKVDAALDRRATGEAIMTFITDARDGLGVQFDAEGKGPVRSPDQVVADKKATCIEVVLLFLAIARRTGSSAEVVAEERNGFAHLRISIPAQGDSSKSAHAVSLRELLADYHNARAFRDNPYNPENQRETYASFALDELEQAERLDPANFIIAYNKGYVLLKARRFKKALSCLKRAADLNPYYADTFYNLSVLFQHLGDKQEEERYFEKYTTLVAK